MRARIPVSKAQREQIKKAARHHVIEADKAYKALLAYRMMGFVCLALHREFGWGRKRLCRLVLETGQYADLMGVYEGIEDYKLVMDLRSIDMPELADFIELESEKLNGEEQGDER